MKIRRLDTRAELYEENDETFAHDAEIEDENVLDFTPDEYDIEEDLNAPKLAAKYIRDNSGSIAPSSSHFHTGIWYSSTDTDMATGDILETSWHIVEATEAEQRELFALLNR